MHMCMHLPDEFCTRCSVAPSLKSIMMCERAVLCVRAFLFMCVSIFVCVRAFLDVLYSIGCACLSNITRAKQKKRKQTKIDCSNFRCHLSSRLKHIGNNVRIWLYCVTYAREFHCFLSAAI